MLKATYNTEEDVPAELKDHYVQKGERWELNVEIAGVEGVKSFVDFERLNGALRKERNDHKAIKEKFKVLGDRPIDEILSSLDRIPELESQLEALNDPKNTKKIDELVESRLKTRTAPIERERDGLKSKLMELEGEVTTYKGERRTRSIHDAVRTAGTKAKLLPEALEDALLLADRVFDLDESGAVLVKDNVGFTPGVDPTVWFTDMQQKRPHWWGPSGGGGAGGHGGGGGRAVNPWALETWNMTQQGHMIRDNRPQAEQMARAAGVPLVGGIKPEKKK